jgi:excisionase family DNA binding protein
MKETDQEAILLRGSEVAELLSISRAKAYRLMHERAIPVLTFGKSVRCPRAALLEFVVANTQQSGAAAAQPKRSEHLNPPADKPAKARRGKAA